MANDTFSRGNRNDPYGRGGAGGPSTDPLTELARLIGQSDPFAPDAGRRNARGPDPYAPRQDVAPHDEHQDHGHDDRYGDQPYGDDHGYSDGYAAHDTAHDTAHGDWPAAEPYDRHDSRGPQADDQAPYYDDPHDAAHADPAMYAPRDPRGRHGDDEQHPGDLGRFYEEEAPRRRGWLMTTVAMIGLALVGTAAAFAYRAVFTGGPPAMIARDPGPNKIIPSQNADSTTAKNADRLAAAGQDEKFVSHEEQPMRMPDPRSAPAPVTAQTGAFPAAPSAAPAQASPPADTNAPRPIPTVRIRPPDAPLDTAPPRATAPVAPPPRAQAPAAPPSPRASNGPGNGPSNGPLSLSPQGVANTQTAAPAPAPAAPTRTTALAPPAAVNAGSDAGGSGYFVQVLAQTSEDAAQSSFRGAQAKYASLLGGRQMVIRMKKHADGKVFYGAQVGPLSREEATKLCGDLKSAGGSCQLEHH
jgi:hypothetical protein